LYGAIEVLAVDGTALRHTSEFLALHSYIAIHHNYSWLTFRRCDDVRTLLLSAPLVADEPVPLFLGEELAVPARRQVEERLGPTGSCEVRLDGILQGFEAGPTPPHVGLLSIARLPGRTPIPGAEICGNFELLHARSRFDSRQSGADRSSRGAVNESNDVSPGREWRR
jgi:hypothetical protein